MFRRRAEAAVRAGLLVLLAATPQLPTAGAKNFANTRRPAPAASTTCAPCHGKSGEGVAGSDMPRLQGLPSAYLLKQLDGFADGMRQSTVMASVARSLGARERAELADYYAALAGHPRQTGSVSARGYDRLALHGRWSAEIPACVQCHGENGSGIGAAFPALAAQPAAYLAAQLAAWKRGTRRGDPLELMQEVASRLSDADVRGVAAYFAAIPEGATGPPDVPGSAHADEAPSRPAPRPESGTPRAGAFAPADVPIPDDGFGKMVQLGRQIFDDPGRYARSYVGNDLRCTSCHLDEGRRVGSAPMWAAYVSYPAFRKKNGHVNTFAERLQGCFRYSMNGRAPPLGDPVLVALESYSYWMARGAPLDPNIAGRGYLKLAQPALPADRTRGAAVYQQKCVLCHGRNGEGQSANDGSPGFPALWGADSYNWGAGMINVSNAAAFIKSNMPFGLGGTLSDQEAWDVGVFVDSHERPQDPRYMGSVSQTRAQFHDSEDSLYGQRVDGHVLGSSSVSPGHRPPERASGSGGG
jgi:thiosulfate dehydrogenase